MTQPHESLVAWQRADNLCVAIYLLTKDFPAEEKFALSNQVRRAAFSVAANIVEGYAYPKSRARLRFLRTSIASLAELGYGLHLAKRVGYLSTEQWESINDRVRQTAAPLHGLIKQQASSQPSE